MHNNTIILVLGVTLLLAVGALVFGVGKIFYGIAHYYFGERKPIQKFQHPELGLLTSAETDDTLWNGKTTIDGREIDFLIHGDTTAPAEQSVAQLKRIQSQYSNLKREAIDFLRDQEPEIRNATFEVYVIIVPNKLHPKNFTIEFVEQSDDSRVWRVKFIDEKLKHSGFDD